MQHSDITYRLAEEEDIQRYFEWANDPSVRQSAFSSQKISFIEHQEWFQNKLKSGKSILLVYFLGSDAVGQLRIDLINDKLAEIDYSVDKNWRGKGIGTSMLQSARAFSEKLFPEVVLKGVVLVDNPASAKSFKRAGFEREETMKFNNRDCLCYFSK